jgi:hypothetical protein
MLAAGFNENPEIPIVADQLEDGLIEQSCSTAFNACDLYYYQKIWLRIDSLVKISAG